MTEVPSSVNVTVGANDTLERYSRAYLMYVTGTVIYPILSTMNMALVHWQCLEDLSIVNEYAWGAGMLAHIHSALRDAKFLVKGKSSNQFVSGRLTAACKFHFKFFILLIKFYYLI